jgi:hypothetical protein
MYSFIAKTLSRVNPHIFINLEKIDPNEDGLIDFCPICDTKLKDKKVITFKTHEKEFHSQTDKQLLKEYFSRNAVLVMLFGMFIIMGAIIGSSNLYDYMTADERIKDYTLSESCRDTYNDMKIRFFEQKEILQSDLVTLNYIANVCGSFDSNMVKGNGALESIFPYQSVFDDIDYYQTLKQTKISNQLADKLITQEQADQMTKDLEDQIKELKESAKSNPILPTTMTNQLSKTIPTQKTTPKP